MLNNNTSEITYEESRNIAHAGADHERASLAARPDVKPEVLYYLVEDESSQVRLNLAANEATPRLADLVLARDKEEQVRQELAGKIARLVPGLEPDEQDRVYQATIETLEILARDQAIKVRQILAEALKDVAHVPVSVIRQLARDAEIVVSEPVLSFSPVLTDDDILDIISSNPVEGALDAISRRDLVSELVSDAIVESNKPSAIALLLANKSAQIREEALDTVIERAHEFSSWHAPLVERPKLPAKAAVRLARFVAGSLINILQKRGDIDGKYISEIMKIVEKRVEEGNIEANSVEMPTESREPEEESEEESEEGADDLDWVDRKDEGEDEEDDDLWLDEEGKKKKRPGIATSPLDIARNQMADGVLDEPAVAKAVERGDVDLVLANIAVMGELDMALVEKAADAVSAKAVMAVCWKAGLSAKLAEEIQSKVAGLKEDQVMPAKGSKYPISNDELKAELEALAEA